MSYPPNNTPPWERPLGPYIPVLQIWLWRGHADDAEEGYVYNGFQPYFLHNHGWNGPYSIDVYGTASFPIPMPV